MGVSGSMRVDMYYGKGTLPVELAEDWDVTVIRKPDMPVIPDARAVLEAAFDKPVGVSPLDVLARDAKSACILICDITRPVPNGLILGPLVRRLLDAGIEAKKITILIATGLHRPNEGVVTARNPDQPVLKELAV